MKDKCDPDIHIPCPACESTKTSSVISKTSFSLRGSGWYRDGYQKPEGKK